MKEVLTRWGHGVLLLTLVCSAPASAQIAFTPEQVLSTAVTQPSDLDLGDLDGDGITDLVVMEAVPGLVSQMWVYPGLAGGGFGAQINVDISTLLIPIRVLVEDFTGDSLLDILVIEASSNGQYLLFTNLGGFTFTMSSGEFSFGVFTADAQSADLNADGIPDIATVTISFAGTSTGRIFFGNGSGGFGPAQVLPLSSVATALTTADFNGDQLLDLAFGHNSGMGGGLSVCLALTAGEWPTCVFTPGPVGVFSLVTDDFNEDGVLDLAGSAVDQDAVFLTLGTGSGAFGTINYYPVAGDVYATDTADFDDDGHRDLVAFVNDANQISVLRGNGLGDFTSTSTFTATDPYRGRVTDTDQDGKDDLVTVSISGQVSFFVNTSTPTTDPDFIRGDADGDGAFVGLNDALFILQNQFQGGPPPPCREAADANGDATVSGLTDGLYTLIHQFGGGPPPPAPYPACGQDPEPATGLGCLTSGCP